MKPVARKYNPGFLSDEELVASFRVREHEFETVVEALREADGAANPHRLVIGPRGAGKTMLLLRAAAEIRRDPDLSARFFPVVFAEESYRVSTAGEFWLEALDRLADRAPAHDGAPDLRATWEDLRATRDDRALGERCLAALLDFADREGKRLVLVVENLNAMFADMADGEAGWRLRKVLQTEPRIFLLASATARFDEIDDPDRALYDLLKVDVLRPLDTAECAALWEGVAGQPPAGGTIRALEILTGGSPRLIAILARFGAGRAFREPMAGLLDLVDDRTEYFRSHLEALPAQERRVYLALAELWRPAEAREVAERARLGAGQCSAHLARLIARGAAVEAPGGGRRRKLYYLSERLYNIYWLMRGARGPDPMVAALVRFMEGFYGRSGLGDIAAGIAGEADGLDGELRQLHRLAFERLVALPALEPDRAELLAMAPRDFIDGLDWSRAADAARPPDGEGAAAGELRELLGKASALMNDPGRMEDALALLDDAVDRFGANEKGAVGKMLAWVWWGKGYALEVLKRPLETIAALDESVRRLEAIDAPVKIWAIAHALVHKGRAFAALGRSDEAIAVWDELARRFGNDNAPDVSRLVAEGFVRRGRALAARNRPKEAIAAWDEGVRRFGKDDRPKVLGLVAEALLSKGAALEKLDRLEQALVALEHGVTRLETIGAPELDVEMKETLIRIAQIKSRQGLHEEALEAVDRAFDRLGARQHGVRFLGHLIRAVVAHDLGDRSACERGLADALAVLPELGVPPREIFVSLLRFANALGPARMLELVRASPSADSLLPFATALERELGIESRVAIEVEEVAADIRRELARLRESETPAFAAPAGEP